ncbi:hypothetical protein K488DRAFT_23713, partial [Vararia minispora EC-137]
RNEGLPEDWAYHPPEYSAPAEYGVEFGEFDYDAVKEDEEAELWIVRAPTSLKPKHFHNLRLSVPSSRPGIVGSVERKNATYDVWACKRDGVLSGEHSSIPGEELSTLSVLLPRSKKGGRLYQTAKPVTGHFAVVASPTRSTVRDGDAPELSSSFPVACKNSPRFSYPEHLLKHRFMPCGS